MPDYLVLAYPIVATKTPNPITANDPSAAIAAFVEQVNWEALFDPVSQAKEVDYAVATLYFEAFEVRLAGDETAPSWYYCGDGQTLLPAAFAGGVTDAAPKFLSLLLRAREMLAANLEATDLVAEINQLLGDT
ncbi:MAG: hypothetical protein KJ077_00775 [Anaerolineae bacterium]|nr:hypothetical protein [Anaerolineae bacterium]